MIGMGDRSMDVRRTWERYKAVCFAVTGNVGALVPKTIKEAAIIAYSDVGAEALRRLAVSGLRASVVSEIYGGNAYEAGKARYGR
jgi:fumarate hydratase subunit beta